MDEPDVQVNPAPPAGEPALELLLRAPAVEAVRLLGADGALVYLLEPGERVLRFAAVASQVPLSDDHWAASAQARVDVGLFGRAVASASVESSGDYLADPSFEHTAEADAFARATQLRSFVVAPLAAGQDVIGVLGVYDSRPDAFGPQQIALVRALAGHAGLEVANARLIAQLDEARLATRRQAEVERALRELGTRISGERDLVSVVGSVVEAAVRLTGADGGRVDILDPTASTLVAVYAWGAGNGAGDGGGVPPTIDERVEMGIAGRAILERSACVTADYLVDAAFPHAPAADDYVRANAIRAVAAVPLLDDERVIGSLTVWSLAPATFDAAAVELLVTIAGQAAVALDRERLIEELGRSREAQARRADEERALRDLARRAMTSHDPEDVLDDVVREAARLLGPGGAVIELARPARGGIGTLRSAGIDTSVLRDWRAAAGAEASRRAVAGRRAVLGEASGEIRSWAVAPLIGEAEIVGTLAVLSPLPGAFGPEQVGLLGSLADHAALALAGVHLTALLEESEARYRFLVQSSPDLVWVTDAAGRITYASDRAGPVVGWDAEHLVGRTLPDLAAPGEINDWVARFDWLRQYPGVPHRNKFRILTEDGSERLIEITGIGMLDAAGEFIGAHGTVRDIRELERLEADLRRQTAELAASEERAHLARELHDSVTQALFSMTLQTRSIELLLERDTTQVPPKLAELRDLQRDALAEMRALILELHPGNLAENGVVAALRTHAVGLSGRIGLPIIVDAELDRRPASLEVEEALYRIGQEALHNVVKHAGARHVRVELGRRADGIRVLVEDDGHGFDPHSVPDGHFGLAGMQARAERLGGWFAVRSEPGRGTVVEAVIPDAPGNESTDTGAAGLAGAAQPR